MWNASVDESNKADTLRNFKGGQENGMAKDVNVEFVNNFVMP